MQYLDDVTKIDLVLNEKDYMALLCDPLSLLNFSICIS